MNIETEDLHVVYVWVLPGKLLLPPSYKRKHFDSTASRNRVVTVVGEGAEALPIEQELKISRLASDTAGKYEYRPASMGHGVYVFVLEGAIKWGDVDLGRRDSAGTWETNKIAFQTGKDKSDILFIETIL